MLLFGAAQLVLSFIPNLHNMAWISVVAAIMSFAYSTIGFGLGLAKTIGNNTGLVDPVVELMAYQKLAKSIDTTAVSENGAVKGSIAGVPMSTPTQRVWRVAQAIGDIAFAYPYTIVLLEIQVRQPFFLGSERELLEAESFSVGRECHFFNPNETGHAEVTAT
jgi:hypothetical protein